LDQNIGLFLLILSFRRPTVHVVLLVISSWEHSVCRARNLCRQNHNGMLVHVSYFSVGVVILKKRPYVCCAILCTLRNSYRHFRLHPLTLVPILRSQAADWCIYGSTALVDLGRFISFLIYIQ
jgi:hypothetical protein